jgi:hypothetical protein
MGFDRELVREARGKHMTMVSETLEGARSIDGGDPFSREPEGDASVQLVLFAEAYVLIDLDGDGVPERRLFRCIGPDFKIVGEGELVDDVPFADFPMDPEPHSIVGESLHDMLRDVQLVKTQVLRSTLNSLSLSLDQKTEVVAGEVNIDDLTKNELGGIVRVRKPGMMREVTHQFMGPATLPVLEYYDELKENRTGISKAAAGLDADSLQSATKAAVSATLSGAQQHIEQIARVLAETGMRRLYKGLLRMVVKHQDRPKMIRMRGEFVEVDPRYWNAELDVTVTLSSGSPEDKMNLLGMVAAKQEQLMQMGSPIVGPAELRNTYARLLELGGYRNADEFFKPWGPEQEQQAAQQAQQEGPQDPMMVAAQAEMQKAQADIQIGQAKLELEWWKAQREDDRERDKIARDTAVKMSEMQLKYATTAQTEQLYATVEADRVQMDADIKREEAEMQQAAQQQEQQAAQQAAGGVEGAEA